MITVTKAGVVRAKGKLGDQANITVTSKKDKKKKAVIKVKIGTPVKSLKMNKKKLTLKERKAGKILRVKFNPKKPTLKKVKWTSSNKKVVRVNAYGTVQPVKKGNATITATAKDGSNKKAKCKVTVQAGDPPAAPPPPPKADDRRRTMAEDFESYAIGTTWKITTGEYANPATATVVADPMKAGNKVLKIDYDGKTQAYDVAPIFTINLKDLPNIAEVNSSPVLDHFTGFTFKVKIESNSADCVHKPIYGYFDDAGKLNSSYYFSTSINPSVKGKEEIQKLKVENPMATGPSEDFTDPATKKSDSHKFFPYYHTGYPTDKSKVSPGYADVKNDKTIQMTDRIINFDKTKMRDAISGKSFLQNESFDLVFGSTYSGAYVDKATTEFMVMYLDDIQLLSPSKAVGLQKIDVELSDNHVGEGLLRRPKVKFTPSNTTQTAVEWSSADESIISIDKDTGYIVGESIGTTKIRATSKDVPSIYGELEVTVHEVGTAENESLSLLDYPGISISPKDDTFDERYRSDASSVYVPENEATTEKGAGLHINYTAADEAVVIDLGEEVNFAEYNSLEIVGSTPGCVAVELYDSNFSKTTDTWWETTEGAAYPFFNGSCATRLELGTYNEAAYACTEETAQFGWDSLSNGDTRGGDFTKIRYIILKSNLEAVHQLNNLTGYGNDNYWIKSLSLSIKKEVPLTQEISLKEMNESAATSQTKNPENNYYTNPVFNEDGSVSFTANSNRSSGMAFYINELTAENGEEVTSADVSGFKYVKVEVEAPNNLLALVGLPDGSDWSAASMSSGNWITEKDSSFPAERTIYFSLEDPPADLSSIQAFGIKSTQNRVNIKIKSMLLIKYEPEIPKGQEATISVVKKGLFD
ncbi:MAG: Ig-like domain-containing protein [Lachnoclostridium sp.]|nr:Ig-like domain-containing protein [Lachnoclostridium sp.]